MEDKKVIMSYEEHDKLYKTLLQTQEENAKLVKQVDELKAKIPFAFRVGYQSLPKTSYSWNNQYQGPMNNYAMFQMNNAEEIEGLETLLKGYLAYNDTVVRSIKEANDTFLRHQNDCNQDNEKVLYNILLQKNELAETEKLIKSIPKWILNLFKK